MTPGEIRKMRIEFGLSVGELAAILNVTERELEAIESGQSRAYTSESFEEAFAAFEACAFETYIGA